MEKERGIKGREEGRVERREGWREGKGGEKGRVERREGWREGKGGEKGRVERREGWREGKGGEKGRVERRWREGKGGEKGGGMKGWRRRWEVRIHIHPSYLLAQRQVYSALSQISKHSVELAELVVEAEVFPTIFKCLKDPDEYVKKNVATLIREIAKHTPEVKVYLFVSPSP